MPGNLSPVRRKYPSLSSACGELERVITYDACDYEYQVREIDKGHREQKDYQSYRERKSRMKEGDILLPTVTMVLYLGEGHWEGRRKLTQMFRLSAKCRNLLGANLHDYDFPLLEADFVEPGYYRTDLKEFFQAMQCRKDKVKLRELFGTDAFRHLSPETEQVIVRHLYIERLAHKMEKEGLPMCKAFDDLMDERLQEGKAAGRKEGKKEGKKEEKIKIIRQMIKEGLDEALIHRTTRCTREEFSTAMR